MIMISSTYKQIIQQNKINTDDNTSSTEILQENTNINTNNNTQSTNTIQQNTKNTDIENKRNNNKVEIHPLQAQNIATRKKQNTYNNNEEYTMHKDPPTLNDENFPEITCTKTQSNANNIAIIPETPIEQQQRNEETIKFLSPPIISKTTLTNSTP